MIAAFSPFLALRYLLQRRINVIALFGVAFAVWAMILVDSVFTGFVTDIRDDTRNSAPDLLLTELPNDTGYEALRAAMVAEPGVVAVAPRLRYQGLFQPLRQQALAARPSGSSQVDFDRTEDGFALLLGIDPDAEVKVTPLSSWIDDAPEEAARHYPVQLDRSPVLDEPDPERRALLKLPDEVEWRARRRADLPAEDTPEQHRSAWPGLLLGIPRVRHTMRSYRGMRLGDPLTLMCAAFSGDAADARMRPQSTRVAFAGWFATKNRLFDETMVLLPIETLRTLLGNDAANPTSIDLVTDVAIKVDPKLSAGDVRALAQRLQQRAQPLLPVTAKPCAVLDWVQQNDVFLSAVAHEQAMMQFVLFVVMLVAAFVIYATLHMMVTQKVKDIGILAAVGGTPRGIGAVFLISGLVVASAGAAIGIGLGILSVLRLNWANDWLYAHFHVELFPRNLFDLQQIPVHVEPSWVVGVAVGAVVLALAVAYVPSRRAARMNPVKALSYE